MSDEEKLQELLDELKEHDNILNDLIQARKEIEYEIILLRQKIRNK